MSKEPVVRLQWLIAMAIIGVVLVAFMFLAVSRGGG